MNELTITDYEFSDRIDHDGQSWDVTGQITIEYSYESVDWNYPDGDNSQFVETDITIGDIEIGCILLSNSEGEELEWDEIPKDIYKKLLKGINPNDFLDKIATQIELEGG